MTLTDLAGTPSLPDLTITTRVLFATGGVTSRLIPLLMLLGPVLLTMLAVINRRLANRPTTSNVWLWALVVGCAFVAEIGLASVLRRPC